MRHARRWFFTLVFAALPLSPASSAWARAAAPTVPISATSPISSGNRARAYLELGIQQPNAWVGQAIPISVTAHFRGVDGITLQGAPQLTSKDVFTSELSKEPRQSTEVIEGEPTVAATWTGTITPSSAGPIALTVELPVVLR
ncbi:MAG TPA: hypothetical protein VGL13_09825, partial [Polyangiaceae bacterium]